MIQDLSNWAKKTNASKGDLIIVLSGEVTKVRAQLSALRLELAQNLNLRNPNEFAPLWITDFPLLEWDDESQKYHAMHHPFTSPKLDEIDLLETNPEKVRANAYDLAINGVEVGGGSIRIHDRNIQEKMFEILGFSKRRSSSSVWIFNGGF